MDEPRSRFTSSPVNRSSSSSASQRPVRSRRAEFPEIVKPAETGAWEVSFDPKEADQQRRIHGLEDWSHRPEEGITATIPERRPTARAFDLPPDTDLLAGGNPDRRWWLDLGTVKNLARVRLNGRDLGVVWCAPWRVEITSAARSKGNRLEIDVANLWPNRLIGDEQLPPDADYGKDGEILRWPEWVLKKRASPVSRAG